MIFLEPLSLYYQLIKTPFTTFNTPNTLASYLPFAATSEQTIALAQIEQFIGSNDDFLIVRGAAGTGKTSIMKAVADYLSSMHALDFCLLAPTGRAAKNIAKKANYEAQTLHSHLYYVAVDTESGLVRYTPKENRQEYKTVYIVDESSMVGNRLLKQNEGYEVSNPILTDFVRNVRTNEAGFQVIFVGDNCQLPPVGYASKEVSPALSVEQITNTFQLKGSMIELSRVMRQNADSYILKAAYGVRDCFLQDRPYYNHSIGQRIGNKFDAVKTYLMHYDANNFESVAIIGMSNSYVNECNTMVRNALGLNGTLTKGDRVVLDQSFFSHQRAIANGESGLVMSTGKTYKVAELSFMDVELEFYDASGEAYRIFTKVMLDTLVDEKSVTPVKKTALFGAANRNNSKFRNSKDIRDDEYLSAMQLKYGHAFTCHKAQGSEWDTVILNTWMPKDQPDFRFLYTGITRARTNLYSNNSHLYR